MPTPTYTALANITLTGTPTTVTFGSIPATYRDLVLIIQAGVSQSSEVRIRFNSDTSSTYTMQQMNGDGTSATAGTQGTGGNAFLAFGNGRPGLTSNALMIANIMDYSATDKHKTMIGRSDNAALGTQALANRWASTAAINNIQVSLQLTTIFSVGSTFALYGIVA